MQIYLSKPGGQKEGPYSLEEVNDALAKRTYRGSDYWAWYDGLAQWVPLSSVPGVRERAEPAAIHSSSGRGFETQWLSASSVEGSAFQTEVASDTQLPTLAPPVENNPVSAGLPFSALEQIFILTTGEGQTASRSPVTTSLLQEVIGEDWETIRQVVPRDAIAKCAVLNEMGNGHIPQMVWRAMTAFKPLLLQHAREGMYRICIRNFRIEDDDLVSVFLFYSKQKLK